MNTDKNVRYVENDIVSQIEQITTSESPQTSVIINNKRKNVQRTTSKGNKNISKKVSGKRF